MLLTPSDPEACPGCYREGDEDVLQGVLLNSERHVLHCRPKGVFDGYGWTLPKGSVDILTVSLQANCNSEAKRLLPTIASFRYNPAITGELSDRYQTSLYSDSLDAVFKVPRVHEVDLE